MRREKIKGFPSALWRRRAAVRADSLGVALDGDGPVGDRSVGGRRGGPVDGGLVGGLHRDHGQPASPVRGQRAVAEFGQCREEAIPIESGAVGATDADADAEVGREAESTSE